jgi:hypothetical protein
MTMSKKITMILVVLILVIFSIWIIVLRGKLNNINNDSEDHWKDKYESAQDSINSIVGERDKLRLERDKLDSLRVYWINQYNYKDKLLKRVKSQYNEKVSSIRHADANGINDLLTEKLDSINNHKR